MGYRSCNLDRCVSIRGVVLRSAQLLAAGWIETGNVLCVPNPSRFRLEGVYFIIFDFHRSISIISSEQMAKDGGNYGQSTGRDWLRRYRNRPD